MLAALARKWLPRFSRSWRRGSAFHRPAAPCGSLHLEALEDRTLLSTSLPLSPTTWTDYGPAPITNGQTPGPSPVSGRVTGLATDPNNPDILYAATAGGGIWETTNATSANPIWTPLTESLTDSNGNLIPDFMGAVALGVNPSNTSQQVLYAGTGEANNSIDSFYGTGILVSTNGGKTWTLTGQSQLQGMAISRIAVDPQNPNIAYAAVNSDAQTGVVGSTGIYKTVNAGQSWINVTAAQGLDSYDSWSDVVIDPSTTGDNAVLFAALGEVYDKPSNGVYESTNGGSSWTLVSGLPSGTSIGRIALAISHPVGDAYATIYASIAGAGFSGSLSSLQKSTNGGSTWTDLTSNLNGDDYLSGQGGYDNVIEVDPTNPNIVFAAGVLLNQGPTFSGGGIVESQDGGLTWTDGTTQPDINTGTAGNNGPHTDYHALAFDASGRIVVGNDGGVWRLNSNDLTTPNIAWTDLNTNLNTIQFYGVSLDAQNANAAFGASQDNGAAMFNDTGAGASAARGWSLVNDGDGGIVRVDPSNGSIVYLTVPGVNYDRFILESTDGGNTFYTAGKGIQPTNNANFVVPFTIDPNNNSRLLLGTNQVYETTDGGQTPSTITWQPLQSSNFVFPAAINSIAIAPTDSSTLYVAAGDKVYVTTNNGLNWTKVTPLGASGKATSVTVDPTNSQTAYVVYAFAVGSGSASHVFETTNGGTSWTDISGTTFPDSPARSVIVVPGTTLLAVGTDVGVYSTTVVNGASTVWVRDGSGLPHAQVADLQSATINGQIILAAGTHGRGLWEMEVNSADLIVANTGPSTAVEGDTFTYTLTVNNTGPTAAQNVALTDALPAGLTFLSATISQGSFTQSDGVVTYALGTIAAGSTVTVTLTVQAIEDGNLTDTATVSSSTTTTGSNQAKTTTTVTEGPSSLTASALQATEFSALNNAVVATFVHANAVEPARAFTATINWGDGSTSTGTVVQNGSTYRVLGSHTYSAEGNHTLTVTVSEDNVSASSSAGVQVAEAPLPTGVQNLPWNQFVFETLDDLFGGAMTANQVKYLGSELLAIELAIVLTLQQQGMNSSLALGLGVAIGEAEFAYLASALRQNGSSLNDAAGHLGLVFGSESYYLASRLPGDAMNLVLNAMESGLFSTV